jgi:hypothetical protein
VKTLTPLKEYARIMGCVELDESAKQQIIRNCARRSTLEKMRSGKYKLVAVKKEKLEKF